MECPQCQNGELNASGMCPACGYHTATGAPEPEAESSDAESRNFAGMIEIDYAEGNQEPEHNDEQPQWRQELSKRLQAIRQRKETISSSRQSGSVENNNPQSMQHSPAVKPPIIPPSKFVEGPPPPKRIQKPRSPIPSQRTLQPLVQQAHLEKPDASHADPEEIQDIIDNAVSRKSTQSGTFEAPAGFFHSHGGQPQGYEGKLILLSRTLSGLVDLIIVILCTGILIIAADVFSGIIALDAVSYLCFSVLFLLTYFSYSLFFMGASSQTVGMMITNLRVVGAYEERPSLRQIVHRCWGYLVSVLGFGFGLIWGVFDRESLCFHDRISDTHVIRL